MIICGDFDENTHVATLVLGKKQNGTESQLPTRDGPLAEVLEWRANV
jgi:hypothetical protein